MGEVEPDLILFLEDAADYFEKRPTGGEDRAHWANVYNAENCRKAGESLSAKDRMIAELTVEVADLKARLTQCEHVARKIRP